MKNVFKAFVVRGIGYSRLLRAIHAVRSWQEHLRPGELSAVRDAIGRDSLVFDIGANIGYTTRLFSRMARVVAVEPDPDNFSCLVAELAQEPGVELVPQAVGRTSGFVGLEVPMVAGVKQHALARVGGSGSIPMCTVDELAARFGTPDFVKIDVEGFEGEVLIGMQRTIAARPSIYVEVCGSANILAWADVVQACRYRCLAWHRERFAPTTLDRSGNFLLLPAEHCSDPNGQESAAAPHGRRLEAR